MKKILLDTNAYSEFLIGDEAMHEAIENADLVLMSTFVLGELFAGFKGGNREQVNKQILQKFRKKAKVQVISASAETAEIFGEIKHALRKAGTPIPTNDVWIAAHAFEAGAVLVTYDRHFKQVAGLRLWNGG